jgi:hypothetical protein
MDLWAKLMANQDLIDLLAITAVVAGLSVCLFGLRIWRFALGGVAAGFGVAGGAMFAASRAPDRMIIIIGLSVAAGCVLMIAFATLYRLGTMIVVAAIGWYVGVRIGSMMAVEGIDLLACAVGGALLLGVVAVLVEMPVIICLSAFSGAWSVVWGVSLYFGNRFHEVLDVWKLTEQGGAFAGELLALALLAAVGLALQVVAFIRSGPDMAQINHALDCADLPHKRRIAVLDDLRSDGTISRSEYFRHLIRVLSSSSWSKTKSSTS